MSQTVIMLDRMDDIITLFGKMDENIRLIERELGVEIIGRDGELKIIGEDENIDKAKRTIHALLDVLSKGEPINEQLIRYTISMVHDGLEEHIASMSADTICVTSRGKSIKAKTVGQKQYVKAIENSTISFCIGPAGTGKTYLAVAMAVKAFRNKEVTRIILTRPAVEAGEKLGFLPGDLQDKIDPYLRPLYDALGEMLGQESYLSYMEKGLIEVAPLAYMRGRTLEDAFIILDEAQNTTSEQMKMFLTRLGMQGKMIVTGDITQIDLPRGTGSGLKEAIKCLDNVDGISISYLTNKDVVRNPIVQRVINAYEQYYKRGKHNG